MMILLKNATVIPGDGKKILAHTHVLFDHGEILAVTPHLDQAVADYAEVVDCSGKAVLPGLINHHAHGVVMGPLLAGGGKCIGRDKVLEQLDKHLLAGHTTVLSMDGFATMDEVEATQKLHPMRIKTATTHLPLSLKTALTVDGGGLAEKHRTMTAERMLEDGALCIGEIGSGNTTGGGDPKHFIQAVLRDKNIETPPGEAKKLLKTVLGKYADAGYYNRERVEKALAETVLQGSVTPEECRDLAWEANSFIYDLALEAYDEAVEAGIRYGVPVLLHHSPSTQNKIFATAARGLMTLIACHSNLYYTRAEAIEVNRRLKEYYGVFFDDSALDTFSRGMVEPSPESFFALYEAGLVDMISTDYALGFPSPLLKAAEAVWQAGLATLPAALSHATTNPARIIPGLAPRLGLLAKGYIADILVAGYPQVSQIERVYVGGKLVAENGHTSY